MKLTHVGYIVVHCPKQESQNIANPLGLCYANDASSIDNEEFSEAFSSLFYDEVATVFPTRKSAREAIKRTQRNRWDTKGELKIEAVRLLKEVK